MIDNPIVFRSKVSLIGENRESTMISAQLDYNGTYMFNMKNAKHITLENFKIFNSSTTKQMFETSVSENVIIRNNHIYSNNILINVDKEGLIEDNIFQIASGTINIELGYSFKFLNNQILSTCIVKLNHTLYSDMICYFCNNRIPQGRIICNRDNVLISGNYIGMSISTLETANIWLYTCNNVIITENYIDTIFEGRNAIYSYSRLTNTTISKNYFYSVPSLNTTAIYGNFSGDGTRDVTISNNHIEGYQDGIRVMDTTDPINTKRIIINNNTLRGVNCGIVIYGIQDLIASGNIIEAVGTSSNDYGIKVMAFPDNGLDSENIKITGNIIDAENLDAINIIDSKYITINDNTITNCKRGIYMNSNVTYGTISANLIRSKSTAYSNSIYFHKSAGQFTVSANALYKYNISGTTSYITQTGNRVFT